MKTRTLVALLSCLALTFFLYVTPSANAASDEEEIIQVSKDFVKWLETDDSKIINSLYWKSPKISTWGPDPGDALLTQGWEESETDTSEVSETEVSEITWTVSLHHPQVTMLGDDTAVTTVYHLWIYTNTATNEQTYEYVRQTEVVKKINGKWLLVHVHASYLPVE